MHAVLRRIYNKITLENPHITATVRLATAVKAVNDIAGTNGLVPSNTSRSLLVFEVIPKIPGAPGQSTSQNERHAARSAREEYVSIFARRRVQEA